MEKKGGVLNVVHVFYDKSVCYYFILTLVAYLEFLTQ